MDKNKTPHYQEELTQTHPKWTLRLQYTSWHENETKASKIPSQVLQMTSGDWFGDTHVFNYVTKERANSVSAIHLSTIVPLCLSKTGAKNQILNSLISSRNQWCRTIPFRVEKRSLDNTLHLLYHEVQRNSNKNEIFMYRIFLRGKQ